MVAEAASHATQQRFLSHITSIVHHRQTVLPLWVPCYRIHNADSAYRFPPRHNALGPKDVRSMLDTCKASDIDDLMDSAMPKTLPRLDGLEMGIYTKGMTEAAFLEHFKHAPDATTYFIADVLHNLPAVLFLYVMSAARQATCTARASTAAHRRYTWLQGDGAEEQGPEELHRHGLLWHPHARCHHAQPAGEPRLVHPVHAIPV